MFFSVTVSDRALSVQSSAATLSAWLLAPQQPVTSVTAAAAAPAAASVDKPAAVTSVTPDASGKVSVFFTFPNTLRWCCAAAAAEESSFTLDNGRFNLALSSTSGRRRAEAGRTISLGVSLLAEKTELTDESPDGGSALWLPELLHVCV